VVREVNRYHATGGERNYSCFIFLDEKTDSCFTLWAKRSAICPAFRIE
jgi:hypothetical protein